MLPDTSMTSMVVSSPTSPMLLTSEVSITCPFSVNSICRGSIPMGSPASLTAEKYTVTLGNVELSTWVMWMTGPVDCAITGAEVEKMLNNMVNKIIVLKKKTVIYFMKTSFRDKQVQCSPYEFVHHLSGWIFRCVCYSQRCHSG